MKNRTQKRVITSVFTFFVLLVALIVPAFAETKVNESVSIQISQVTPAVITQGEPIMLHYKLTNDGSQKIGMRLGFYNTEWYSLSLTDDAGQTAKVLPDLRPAEPAGYHSGPLGVLASKQVTENYIVVSKGFEIQHSGHYMLTLHVHMPYTTVGQTEESPIVLEEALKTAATSFFHDFTFPITVIAANASHLQTVAEALRQEIGHEQNGLRLHALFDALFAMPEAQSAGSWETLANQPGMETDLIASELEYVHSQTAADILAQMLSNPGMSSDNVNHISQCLNEMYNSGSPDLRKHIQEVGASYGISLPEKVNTQVYD